MSRQTRVCIVLRPLTNQYFFISSNSFISINAHTSSGRIFANVVRTTPRRTFQGGPKSYCTVTNKYYYITARRIRRKLNAPRSQCYCCSSLLLCRFLRDTLIKLHLSHCCSFYVQKRFFTFKTLNVFSEFIFDVFECHYKLMGHFVNCCYNLYTMVTFNSNGHKSTPL